MNTELQLGGGGKSSHSNGFSLIGKVAKLLYKVLRNGRFEKKFPEV